jgi:NAD(P)-dependent dehydrogenase (short-subunit alcohol dehydrogenase family)
VELEGKHVVVTGGAGGIGKALVEAFAAEGAAKVVVADFNQEGAESVAAGVDGHAVGFDAGNEDSVLALIAEAEEANGPIDVFFSNAGIAGPPGGPEASDEEWDQTWRVNVMSHIWAARDLAPKMRKRDSGYLLNTASAAGLLTQVSALAYSVTKAAAVALAEWLAVNHAGTGVKVSCLCPLGVKTPMLDFALQEPVSKATMSTGAFLEPSDVAETVVEAMRDERFLILPHPEVSQYQQLKAAAPDKWIDGMRQLMDSAR